jgi:hypothetical protein
VLCNRDAQGFLKCLGRLIVRGRGCANLKTLLMRWLCCATIGGLELLVATDPSDRSDQSSQIGLGRSKCS